MRRTSCKVFSDQVSLASYNFANATLNFYSEGAAQVMEERSNYLSSRKTLGALAKNRINSKLMCTIRQDVQYGMVHAAKLPISEGQRRPLYHGIALYNTHKRMVASHGKGQVLISSQPMCTHTWRKNATAGQRHILHNVANGGSLLLLGVRCRIARLQCET